MTRPDNDDNDVSYNKLIDNICMSLGGRVAEELVIQDVTTGASADLQHVSGLARRMVTQWGMSDKLGLVAYDSDQPVFVGMEYGHSSSSYSEKTAATIDEEVRTLIMTAHERAVKLLKENRSILDNMSRVLVEKETIYTEEVNMLMKGASYKEVVEFMDAQDGSRRINPFEAMTKSTKATSEHVVEGYGEPVKAETETADASGDAEKPEDNSEE
jgi:cell division protease FtsH